MTASAALLRAYRMTRYAIGGMELRIGRRSQPADTLLRNENVLLQRYRKRGKDALLVSSPASVVFARTYFQCATLEGLELEDVDAALSPRLSPDGSDSR